MQSFVRFRLSSLLLLLLRQLIGWTSEGTDGLFGAVETRMADANALAIIQQFVKAHVGELLRCGASLTPGPPNRSLPAGKPSSLACPTMHHAPHRPAHNNSPHLTAIEVPTRLVLV
jgi:hypothetical protein